MIQTEFSIRISFRPRIYSDWKLGFGLKTLFRSHSDFDLGLNRIRLDRCFYQSIRARIDSDWKLGFGLVRINLDCRLGLNGIGSDWCFYRFLSKELQNVFRIGSEWFALAWIQISDWIGIVLIGSEWIPIRYFRHLNKRPKSYTLFTCLQFVFFTLWIRNWRYSIK